MRVLLIDPAANGKKISSSSYNNGLVEFLSNKVELTLAATCDYEKNGRNINVLNCFFHKSNNMKRGRVRSFVRGKEYLSAYLEILKELDKKKYDIVHIQWLLCYPLDILFLHKIKKKTKKIVYTAHNVVPHVNGNKSKEYLKKIYELVDVILVHGEHIKQEFQEVFPEYIHKVKIQHHGEYYKLSTDYQEKNINKEIIKKVESYEKVILFSGYIFYNKGLDILVDIWLKNFKERNALLIITGEQAYAYPEYDRQKQEIVKCDNILRFESFVDTNLFNYLANKSDVMILPYRHASMSAVVFTAAQFGKMVVATKTGALEEYLEENKDSILCSPNGQGIYTAICSVLNDYDKDKLRSMGAELSRNIHKKFSWDKITEELVKCIYKLKEED